jgi:hypothetical protein
VSAVFVTRISASHGTGLSPQLTVSAKRKIVQQGMYRANENRTYLIYFLL